MISSIRSATRHRGVHWVDDTEEYRDARNHGRRRRCRALAFTHAGRRCRHGASSSPFPFDATCWHASTWTWSRLPSFSIYAALRQHKLHKTRMRNFTYICGGSLIDTDWIACSSRMRRANTTTRPGHEATITRSMPCIPRIWKRGALTIEACIPYSRYSQLR
jgi:hypothetical protein